MICPQNNTLPLPLNILQPPTEPTAATVRSSCVLRTTLPQPPQVAQQLNGRKYMYIRNTGEKSCDMADSIVTRAWGQV